MVEPRTSTGRPRGGPPCAGRRGPPGAPRGGRVRVCSRPDPCVAARGRARDAGAGVVYVHFASRTAVFHCQLNHAHAVDTCYTSHLSGTLFSPSPTLSPSLSLSLSLRPYSS